MTEAILRPERRMVELRWADGTSADFPYIWLRDNCPGGVHPDTKERSFDLLSVPADIAPLAAAAEMDAIRIDWPQEGGGTHVSRFDPDWLKAHRPGQREADPAFVERLVWRSCLGAGGVPRANAAEVMADDAALAHWLRETQRTGLSIIGGLGDNAEAGRDVAARVGFLRQTNFGTVFDVISKPDPNNLAYTSHRLPPHTDLPNQELPPGFQFLHCLANEAEGGGSMFCDGFAIAQDLERDDPATFALLAETPVPFRFHDDGCDIRGRSPVIVSDGEGAVGEICFNAHIAAPLDLAADLMADYYPAYRRFMEMTRSPEYLLTLRLAAGEMVVFDNRRVLHGRDAFNPATGFRHLHGWYVDRGEFLSRMRVLARTG